MLNLKFLLIPIFSNILIAVERLNYRQIKYDSGNGCFKTLCYILHDLTYSNWNEFYSNNLTCHIDIFKFVLKIWKLKPVSISE